MFLSMNMGLFSSYKASNVWTPLQVSPSLWLDASDSSTITESSGAVSQWDDKSGNGNNAVQGVGAEQPITDSVAIGTKNAIHFDSGLKNFDVDSIGDFNFLHDGTGGSVFMVYELQPTGQGTLLMYSTRVASNGILFRTSSLDRSNIFIEENDVTITVATTGNDTFPQGSSHIHSLHLSNSQVNNVQMNLDSVNYYDADYTGSTPVGGFDQDKALQLGLGATFYLGEMIICNSILSETDRQKLEGYLAHKWGLTANLPSDHPYKTVTPI